MSNSKGKTNKNISVAWQDHSWNYGHFGNAEISTQASARPATKPLATTQKIRVIRGFTIIELLVVISIISILAGLLLPALGRAKLKAQVLKAKTEMANMESALVSYKTEYGTLPNPFGFSDDFTYGTLLVTDVNVSKVGTTQGQTNNAELMHILMNVPLGANANRVKNPRSISFLNPNKSSVTNRFGEGVGPGVGPDYVYRDPWGTPYVITLDYNYDDFVVDSMYKENAVNTSGTVTSSPVSLIKQKIGTSDLWVHAGSVMIWSLGPDKQANSTVIAIDSANKSSVNNDNVISWK